MLSLPAASARGAAAVTLHGEVVGGGPLRSLDCIVTASVGLSEDSEWASGSVGGGVGGASNRVGGASNRRREDQPDARVLARLDQRRQGRVNQVALIEVGVVLLADELRHHLPKKKSSQSGLVRFSTFFERLRKYAQTDRFFRFFKKKSVFNTPGRGVYISLA